VIGESKKIYVIVIWDMDNS